MDEVALKGLFLCSTILWFNEWKYFGCEIRHLSVCCLGASIQSKQIGIRGCSLDLLPVFPDVAIIMHSLSMENSVQQGWAVNSHLQRFELEPLLLYLYCSLQLCLYRGRQLVNES